ncbi:MAG TPA: hypothetical protein VKX16_13770 [Chloroflexota bacterium]|nr:hypothetical protein [Chloroflexota bacterium]
MADEYENYDAMMAEAERAVAQHPDEPGPARAAEPTPGIEQRFDEMVKHLEGLHSQLDELHHHVAQLGKADARQPISPDEKELSPRDRLEVRAAWGYPAPDEPRFAARLAVIVAIALYFVLPDKLVLPNSRWILVVLEALLLATLTIATSRRQREEARPWQRVAALALIAVINLANIISLAFLVDQLVTGHSKAGGETLLLAGVDIWLTNVLVFGLWYWELDRGGPAARCLGTRREPDFLFPQMMTPEATHVAWHPRFLDYLYVSLTNASAFSPTDTMPLTEWAKTLFGIQSVTSLLTVALVAARAVNILG